MISRAALLFALSFISFDPVYAESHTAFFTMADGSIPDVIQVEVLHKDWELTDLGGATLKKCANCYSITFDFNVPAFYRLKNVSPRGVVGPPSPPFPLPEPGAGAGLALGTLCISIAGRRRCSKRRR